MQVHDGPRRNIQRRVHLLQIWYFHTAIVPRSGTHLWTCDPPLEARNGLAAGGTLLHQHDKCKFAIRCSGLCVFASSASGATAAFMASTTMKRHSDHILSASSLCTCRSASSCCLRKPLSSCSCFSASITCVPQLQVYHLLSRAQIIFGRTMSGACCVSCPAMRQLDAAECSPRRTLQSAPPAAGGPHPAPSAASATASAALASALGKQHSALLTACAPSCASHPGSMRLSATVSCQRTGCEGHNALTVRAHVVQMQCSMSECGTKAAAQPCSIRNTAATKSVAGPAEISVYTRRSSVLTHIIGNTLGPERVRRHIQEAPAQQKVQSIISCLPGLLLRCYCGQNRTTGAQQYYCCARQHRSDSLHLAPADAAAGCSMLPALTWRPVAPLRRAHAGHFPTLRSARFWCWTLAVVAGGARTYHATMVAASANGVPLLEQRETAQWRWICVAQI